MIINGMGNSGQKSKFRAAAKACKGKKIVAFRACMKTKLKK
jgi:hypothetical protein